MGILKDQVNPQGRYIKDSAQVVKADSKKDKLSFYNPTQNEKDCIAEFLNDFRLCWQTMHLPRPEFNDMSLYQRHIIDMLAFNTYQENDGASMLEDRLGGWKSNALRPVIRNKAVSIGAHMTARQPVPKIFAFDDSNDEQADSARFMSLTLDWAREQAKYPFQALHRTLASLYSPISWGYTEYAREYRNVKDGKNKDGSWKYKKVIDEEESGFKHVALSTEQVFFPNFFEKDPQKQDCIILRRVISYDRAKAKHGHLPNFVHVNKGVIVTMDDANKAFYNVYDPHMRGEDVEELIRWRKSTDSRDVMINGVLLSGAWDENPRQDHQYPFDCYYYLPINERCIAGKSLVFAMQSDATIVNTLYQLYIDGEILKRFPSTITTGSEKVGQDVIVPGLNLAFAEQDVAIKPINVIGDSQSLATAIEKVETSISESSQNPLQQGQQQGGTPSTAYEISRVEQNAATVLGLAMKFSLHCHVIPYGKLLLSDVLQYLTIGEMTDTLGDELVYKTFYVNDASDSGKKNKLVFDKNMPDELTDDEKLEMSLAILKEQGGMDSNTTLMKANPSLTRKLKYKFVVDGDVLNPRSAELERAYDLETYDRAIISESADQEKIFVDLLMSTNPKTAKNPKAYLKKEEPIPPQQLGPDGKPLAGQQANGGSLPKPNVPIGGKGLPQQMG
jgi:hypothetical protein